MIGSGGAIELPHDAFIPWEKETVFTQRTQGEETGQTHRIAGADEYQLMVEHFAAAVLENTDLEYSPMESIANLRVLDALAEAARTGITLNLDDE